MNKPVKIILIILGILIVIGIIIGVAIYFVVKGATHTAEEIYGGPPPATVMTVMGMNIKPYKMGVFLDRTNQLSVMMMEKPIVNNQKAPFSVADPKDALQDFGGQKQLSQSFRGIENGTPDVIHIGGKTVHTIHYSDRQGHPNQLGILNLDQNELLFVATSVSATDATGTIGDFLGTMPSVSQDSHMTKTP